MDALEFRSKHGNVVYIQKLIGTDRLVVVQSEDLDGFAKYFEFIHNLTILDLAEIIRKPVRLEEEQKVIDDLNDIALSFLKD